MVFLIASPRNRSEIYEAQNISGQLLGPCMNMDMDFGMDHWTGTWTIIGSAKKALT